MHHSLGSYPGAKSSVGWLCLPAVVMLLCDADQGLIRSRKVFASVVCVCVHPDSKLRVTGGLLISQGA